MINSKQPSFHCMPASKFEERKREIRVVFYFKKRQNMSRGLITPESFRLPSCHMFRDKSLERINFFFFSSF